MQPNHPPSVAAPAASGKGAPNPAPDRPASSTAAATVPPGERMMLAVLAGVQFTHIADFMVLMPLGPALMRTFGVGPAALAALVSSYTAASAISGLLSALWIDRVDRRRALLVCYVLFAIATFACGIAPGYATLLAARSAAGAFGGVLGALVFTIIGDAVPDARRGRATGAVMSAFSLASVAGVPIALTLAGEFGWHAPFLFLASVSAVIAVFAWRGLPPLPGARAAAAERGRPAASPVVQALGRLRATVSDPAHLRAYAFVNLVMLSAFMVIPFVSIHLTTNAGVPEASLPVLYLIGGSATFFTARLFGRASDRFGKTRTYRAIAIASIVPLLAVTHLPAVPFAVAVASAGLFFVLISGRMVPAMALVTSTAQPGLRGTFMSLNTSVQSASQALAAFLGGLMVARAPDGRLLHFDRVGWAAVLVTLVAVAWAGRLRPRS